jgi:hypothetical protein
MTPDRTRWCELLVGLERVEMLNVVRLRDRFVVTVESTDRLMGCSACGTRAKVYSAIGRWMKRGVGGSRGRSR